jgi:hypothetical protein
MRTLVIRGLKWRWLPRLQKADPGIRSAGRLGKGTDECYCKAPQASGAPTLGREQAEGSSRGAPSVLGWSPASNTSLTLAGSRMPEGSLLLGLRLGPH